MKQSPRKSATVHPGLQLIDARIRLAQTPDSDTETRRRRQDRVEELEKGRRWQLKKDDLCVPLPKKDSVEQVEGVGASLGEIVEGRAPSAPETVKVPTGVTTAGDRRALEPRTEDQGGEEPISEERQDESPILLTPPQSELLYREVREDIKSTDQKAIFCLVAIGWVLLSLINRGATTSWFYGPTGWLFKDLLSFSAVSGLVWAGYLMLRVLSPSRKEFNPLKALAVKLILLQRGLWIGAVATLLAFGFLIIAKKPRQY